MRFRARVNRFAARKELLLLEARAHRCEIALAYAELGQRVATVSEAVPWRAAAGGLAGAFFLARKSRGLVRWIPAVIAAWRLFKRYRAGRPDASA